MEDQFIEINISKLITTCDALIHKGKYVNFFWESELPLQLLWIWWHRRLCVDNSKVFSS